MSNPVEQAEIAFIRFKRCLKEKPEVNGAKILTVLGSKGGVGSTTVAVNLAVSLAQLDEAGSVALVDLNLFGNIPLFLDVESTHTIAQISQNISQSDPKLVKNTLTRHSSGIYILAPPKDPKEAEAITPYRAVGMLNLMQEVFDYIIVDANRSCDPASLAIIEISDAVFLISTLDLASLKNVRRFLDMFLTSGNHESKIRLIVNGYEEGSSISLEEAQKVLKRKVFWLIPSGRLIAASAINYGKPMILMTHNSKVAKSFKELALTMLKLKAES